MIFHDKTGHLALFRFSVRARNHRRLPMVRLMHDLHISHERGAGKPDHFDFRLPGREESLGVRRNEFFA